MHDDQPSPEFEVNQIVEVVNTDSDDKDFVWRITDVYPRDTTFDYCMARIDAPELWTCWGESHLRCQHEPTPDGTCQQCGIWLTHPDERPVYGSESEDEY